MVEMQHTTVAHVPVYMELGMSTMQSSTVESTGAKDPNNGYHCLCLQQFGIEKEHFIKINIFNSSLLQVTGWNLNAIGASLIF